MKDLIVDKNDQNLVTRKKTSALQQYAMYSRGIVIDFLCSPKYSNDTVKRAGLCCFVHPSRQLPIYDQVTALP